MKNLIKEGRELTESFTKKLNEGKQVQLLQSNIYFHKVGRDTNGNKIVVVSVGSMKPIRIQTNGNLPETHRHITSLRDVDGRQTRLTERDLAIIQKELIDYIKEFADTKEGKNAVHESANKSTKKKLTEARNEVAGIRLSPKAMDEAERHHLLDNKEYIERLRYYVEGYKKRPPHGVPAKNMLRALRMMTYNNTPDDWARLHATEYFLRKRG